MNRPKWKSANAERLVKQRIEKQRKKEISRAFEDGYRCGKRVPVADCKTYKCEFMLGNHDLIYPFETRMEVAKERLARMLAEHIINDMELGHEIRYGNEVWTAMVPVGKTERVVVSRGQMWF